MYVYIYIYTCACVYLSLSLCYRPYCVMLGKLLMLSLLDLHIPESSCELLRKKGHSRDPSIPALIRNLDFVCLGVYELDLISKKPASWSFCPKRGVGGDLVRTRGPLRFVRCPSLGFLPPPPTQIPLNLQTLNPQTLNPLTPKP